MRWMLPFIIFLVTASLAFAENPIDESSTVSGIVLSSEGFPLPGVHVYLDRERGTATNADGWFRLQNVSSGQITINFSMVGYERLSKTINVRLETVHEISVTLEPITYSSGEILVTAGRRAQVAGRVPVSLATVSAQEIERRNIISLDQSLRYVAGVQMAENQVNIRGSTGFSYGVGSRVLLLIDGVPVVGPDQNDIKFDALPMAQVERIEIVKGPGSALYGGGALGGVINLITKDFAETPTTTVRGFVGAYEPPPYEMWKRTWAGADNFRPYQGLVVSHSQKVGDKFGFWIHGMYKDDLGYLENSATENAQVFAKLGFRFSDKSDLSIFGGFRISQNRQFLYWNGLNDPLRAGRIDFGGSVARGGNYVQSEHYSLLPQYRHFITDDLFFTIRGRAYSIAVRPIDSQGNLRPRDQHTVGFRYGSEFQTTWVPTSQTSVIAGISYDDIFANSEFFIGQDSTMLRNQPEYAVFMHVDHDLSRKITVSGGLRYDAYQIDDQDVASRVSPKINLAYSFNEALTVRAAYGLGFRVPGVAERFVNNRDFLPLESNLDLRPETSVGYEIGSNYAVRLSQNVSLDTDIALFWNEYNNLVEPRFVPSLAAFQFINLTEARIRGVETTLRFLIDGGRHRINLGYTFLDHRDLTEDAPLVFRSNHQFVSGAELSLPFGFQFGIDYRFFSKPERVDSDFSRFVVDADQFVAVHVVDARISRNFSLASGKADLLFTAYVNNALQYYYTERPAYLAEPRNFAFSAQIRF